MHSNYALFPQIFTNADRTHASEVLKRLGLEDCFQGVICFETLNPPPEQKGLADEEQDDLYDHGLLTETDSNSDSESDEATDSVNSGVFQTKSAPRKGTKILCKPSLDAIKAAIRIANIDPKRAVSQ